MPDEIKAEFGYGFYQAQLGIYPNIAKTLSGFGSANVIELKASSIDGTYRAVYTVQFRETIYVLHCFKKKSNSGISTPKPDIELIKNRLKVATQLEKSKKR
jgi:phage-related protein